MRQAIFGDPRPLNDTDIVAMGTVIMNEDRLQQVEASVELFSDSMVATLQKRLSEEARLAHELGDPLVLTVATPNRRNMPGIGEMADTLGGVKEPEGTIKYAIYAQRFMPDEVEDITAALKNDLPPGFEGDKTFVYGTGSSVDF